MKISAGKILKSISRVFLYFLGLILLLFFILLLIIRTESAQDFIRKKATNYLSEKLGTSISIGSFRTNLVSHLELQSITVKDLANNELLHIGNIETEFNLFALLNNILSVTDVTVDTLYFRMARAENDSVFNFDFIIRAFSGSPSTDTDIDTIGKPMTFDIGNLTINQLHYVMDDKKGRQFYDVKSGLIAANIDKLDLEHQLYKIKSFETAGLVANLNLGTSAPDTSAMSEGILPQVIIDKISLINTNISVQMPDAGYKSQSSITNFLADNLNLNLNTNKVDLKQLLIDNHQSQVLIQTPEAKLTEAKATKTKVTETHVSESEPFIVTIGSITLKDNDLKYDLGKETGKSSPGFNQEHIDVKQLQLQLEDFEFEGSSIKGTFKQLQAKEKSGLTIQQLSTGFVYTNNGVKLDKLLLKTPLSTIDGDFRISYESLDSISKNPGQLGLDLNIKEILLASRDMKLFQTVAGNNPDINKVLANNIYLEGKLKGKVADMTIENLKLKTDKLLLVASGKLAGLPDPNKLLASVNLKEFSGTTKSLARLLPAGSIPANIAANESFNLKGKLGDNKGAYTFDLMMKSSSGDMVLNGNVNQITGADKLSYNVYAQSDGLLLDRILMDTLYGNTAFDVQLIGKGISPETAESQVKAIIPTVYYSGHNYKTIDLNAAISASVVDADFQILDSSFNTSLTASYSFDTLHPLLKADAHIINIDLHELGFMTDTVKFKGDIVADLTTVNAKHINGTISIPHSEITKGKDVFKLDSISLNAVNIDTTQTFAIKSSFLNMNLDGYYELDVLPDVAQNLLIDFVTVYPPTGTVFKPAYAKLKGELRYNR